MHRLRCVALHALSSLHTLHTNRVSHMHSVVCIVYVERYVQTIHIPFDTPASEVFSRPSTQMAVSIADFVTLPVAFLTFPAKPDFRRDSLRLRRSTRTGEKLLVSLRVDKYRVALKHPHQFHSDLVLYFMTFPTPSVVTLILSLVMPINPLNPFSPFLPVFLSARCTLFTC